MSIRNLVKGINDSAMKCPRCSKPLYGVVGKKSEKCTCPVRFYRGNTSHAFGDQAWVGNEPLLAEKVGYSGLVKAIMVDYFGTPEKVTEELLNTMILNLHIVDQIANRGQWKTNSSEITLLLLKFS